MKTFFSNVGKKKMHSLPVSVGYIGERPEWTTEAYRRSIYTPETTFAQPQGLYGQMYQTFGWGSAGALQVTQKNVNGAIHNVTRVKVGSVQE